MCVCVCACAHGRVRLAGFMKLGEAGMMWRIEVLESKVFSVEAAGKGGNIN